MKTNKKTVVIIKQRIFSRFCGGSGLKVAEKRPFDVLNNALNNNVLVKLKGEVEVRGTLSSFDIHMNIVLDNAEELKNGELRRKLGTVLLRGDTVVFISPSTG